MADAFAVAASVDFGGLAYKEWLSRNYAPAATPGTPFPEVFEGSELVTICTTMPPSPSNLGTWLADAAAMRHGSRGVSRKHAALILHSPEKWRANSELSFYYKVLSRSDGGLCLLEYASAMEYSALAPTPCVVVPLFRQTGRPPKGSRAGVPSQFAADMASAGSGGLNFEASHIASGYFSMLQALAHHISEHTPDSALVEALQVTSHLLSDFAYYASGMAAVAQVIEHLRATTRADDMLQYALSSILASEPFTATERLRLLEINLKRTAKLYPTLLAPAALSRLLATQCLVPSLFGLHRGLLTVQSAAELFAVTRARALAAAQAAGMAVSAWEAGQGRTALPAATQVAGGGQVGPPAEGGGGGGGGVEPAGAAAGEVLPLPAVPAASASLTASSLVKDPAFEALVGTFSALPTGESYLDIMGKKFKVNFRTQREAELLALILSGTGMKVSTMGLVQLVQYCSQRVPIYEGEEDKGEAAEEEAALGGGGPRGSRRSVGSRARTASGGGGSSGSVSGSVSSKSSKSSTASLFTGLKGQADTMNWRDAAKAHAEKAAAAASSSAATPSPAKASPFASSSASVASSARFGGGGGGARSRSGSACSETKSTSTFAFNKEKKGLGGKSSSSSSGSSWGGSQGASALPSNRFSALAETPGTPSSSPAVPDRWAALKSTSSALSSRASSRASSPVKVIQLKPEILYPSTPVVPLPAAEGGSASDSAAAAAAAAEAEAAGSSSVPSPPPPHGAPPAAAPLPPAAAAKKRVLRYKVTTLGTLANLEEFGLVAKPVYPFPLDTATRLFKGRPREGTLAACAAALCAGGGGGDGLSELRGSDGSQSGASWTGSLGGDSASMGAPAAAAAAQAEADAKRKEEEEDGEGGEEEVVPAQLELIPEFPQVPAGPGSFKVDVLASIAAPSSSSEGPAAQGGGGGSAASGAQAAAGAPRKRGTTAPLRIILILDETGSMSGYAGAPGSGTGSAGPVSKRDAVVAVLQKVFASLRQCDSVCVIGMQEAQRLLLPMTRVSSLGDTRESTFAGIAEAVQARAGHTYITQAMELGLEQLEAFKLNDLLAGRGEGYADAMLILSDGQEPPGNTLRTHEAAPAAALARYEQQFGTSALAGSSKITGASGSGLSQAFSSMLWKAERMNVGLSTLGFGPDHDPTLLGWLAGCLGGTFTFVENCDAETAEAAFMGVLGGLMTVVTAAASLRLTLPASCPGCIEAVRTSYPVTLEEGGRAAVVRFGKMSAEERREVVVTLVLDPTTSEDSSGRGGGGGGGGEGVGGEAPSAPPLSTILEGLASFPSTEEAAAAAAAAGAEGDAAGGATASAAQATCQVTRTPLGTALPPSEAANQRLDIARCRMNTGEVMARVAGLVDAGDFAGVASTLGGALESLYASASNGTPACEALIEELEDIKSKTGASGGMARGVKAAALAAASTHSTQKFVAGSAAAGTYLARGARGLLMGGGGGLGGGTGFGRGAGGAGGGAVNAFSRFSSFNSAFCAEAVARIMPSAWAPPPSAAAAQGGTAAAAGDAPALSPPGVNPYVRITGSITTSWSALTLPWAAQPLEAAAFAAAQVAAQVQTLNLSQASHTLCVRLRRLGMGRDKGSWESVFASALEEDGREGEELGESAGGGGTSAAGAAAAVDPRERDGGGLVPHLPSAGSSSGGPSPAVAAASVAGSGKLLHAAAAAAQSALLRAGTTRSSLAVALRISSGPMLFGGCSGATLTHCAEGAPASSRRHVFSSGAVEDWDLCWDLSQPLRVRWEKNGSRMVLQCGESSCTLPSAPAGGHMTLGLLNCIAYLSVERNK